MCRLNSHRSYFNTCWLILRCSQVCRSCWRGGGSLGPVIIMMMKHKSPLSRLTICCVAHAVWLQAVNWAAAERSAKERPLSSSSSSDADDDAQIPPCHLSCFHAFDHFNYMLSAGRDGKLERAWETEHMPERVRVTHVAQSEWGRTHGGPSTQTRAQGREEGGGRRACERKLAAETGGGL